MRHLAIAIAVLAALWSGYWVFGAAMLERRAEAWREHLRSEGWSVKASASVAGFPNRFDLTLKDVVLSDPASGFAWQAPRFQALALSYRRNHVILVWPDEQVIRLPSNHLTIATERMRGSIRWHGGADRDLESSRVVADGLSIASSLGWRAEAASALFALERRSGKDAAYRVGLGVEDLILPQGAELPPDTDGSRSWRVERINVDATAVFDAPLGRSAAGDDLSRLIRVGIDDARARWEDVDMRASGALDISPDGALDGRIILRIENWRGILAHGVDAGYISGATASALEGVLAAFAGGGNTLEAPLVFDGGHLWLGIIPLGPAPRLVIR